MSKLSEKTLKRISDDIIRVIYQGVINKEGRERLPKKGVTERYIADVLGRDKELIHKLLKSLDEKYPRLLMKKKNYKRWCVWDLTPEARIKYSEVL